MRLSYLLIAGLGIVWCLIMGEFSLRQGVIGLIFAAALIWFTGWGWEQSVRPAELPRRLGLLIWLFLVLLPYHIVIANLQMARRLLRRTPQMNPGIVRVPLENLSETEVGLEEQMITLTPGQLVVEYRETKPSDGEQDGEPHSRVGEKVLYVHVLDVKDFEQQEIGAVVWMQETLKRILS